jgi:hypothetical protein
MILTEQFLISSCACANGTAVGISGGYIGMEYGEVIRALIRDGKTEEAGWMIEQKKTELYVRLNGEIVVSDSYQVFDPITGTHTQCGSKEEATAELARVSEAILAYHGAGIVRELRNDKGDSTWVPCEKSLSVTVEVI